MGEWKYMELKKRKYPAKIILFGEYTVGAGGTALAMPYPSFSARWAHDERNYDLLSDYYTYLEEKEYAFLDYSRLEDLKEERHGLDCNIPIGYGLGSSGAITAAIYDSICGSYEEKSYVELKEELGLMESYYHGSSSGTDPLVSLINQPLHIGEHKITVLGKQGAKDFGEWQLFMYDSGKARLSQSFIEFFTEKSAETAFNRDFLVPMKEHVAAAIEAYLSSDVDLLTHFREISRMEYEFMQPMIIESIDKLWRRGLSSGEFYFKLCGAGGGGMYYVYGRTDAIADLRDHLIPL